MHTNNSNIAIFDKVIEKLKWCCFLPHSVYLLLIRLRNFRVKMIEFETEKRCCVGDWQSMAINDDASSVKEKTIIVRQYLNR